MSSRFVAFALVTAFLSGSSGAAHAAQEDEFDPLKVDIVDAIECRLDPGTYTGFAFALDSEEAGYKARGWKKQDSGNSFLAQYRLPEPVTVAGQATRTIVFSSSAIMALLDGDPSSFAAAEKIDNAVPGGAKFLGERLVHSESETAEGMKITSTVKRVLSNVTSHPGKTLLGCSYTLEIED